MAVVLTLATVSGAFAGTVTYTYDDQARLASASYSDSTVICYFYDWAGNRVQYTVSTSACSLPLPVATATSAYVAENSTNTTIPANVTGGSPTSLTVGVASHGTATVTGLAITYTPTTGYVGSDSFSYYATNASGNSSLATVSVTVYNPTLYSYYLTTGGTWSFTIPTGSLPHAIISCGGGLGGSMTTTPFNTGGYGGLAVIDVVVTPGVTTFSGTAGAWGANGTPTGSPGGTSTCSSSSPTVSLTAGGGGGGNAAGSGTPGAASGGDTNTPGGGNGPQVTITQSNY